MLLAYSIAHVKKNTACSKEGSRFRLSALALVAGAVFLAMALNARAQFYEDSNSARKCWSPHSLHERAGENRIQSKVSRAFRRHLPGIPDKPKITSPQWKKAAGKVIRRVTLPKGVKKVALTFDLCEQPHEISGYQGNIVDYLRDQNVKATFFSGGKWLLTHKTRAQQLMADPLFEIANHTWEHRNLRLLKGNKLLTEIEQAQLAYSAVRKDLAKRQCMDRTGRKLAIKNAAANMSLFRFPYGACNKRSLEAVGEAGLLAIQWDVSAGDPSKSQSAQRIRRAVLRRVRPGSIVIFHANGRGWHTPEALPSIIRSLKNRGYEFVTVTELLNTKGAKWEIKKTCYDHHPGDSERYDGLARRLHAFYDRASARHRARHKVRASSRRHSPGKWPKFDRSKTRRKTGFSPR